MRRPQGFFFAGRLIITMNTQDTKGLKTVRDFIRYALTSLEKSDATFMHGYDNPEEEASYLVLRSLKIALESEAKFLDCRLTKAERELLTKNISRRCDDLEPTAYITQEWWLTGFPFYVDDRVLIPRSYLAELLEEGLAPWVQDPEAVGSVLDLCTGSGCLAILAAMQFPNASVDGADISADALEVAKINVADYGMEDTIELVQSDVFSNLEGRTYDVILSNPPYVTTESMENLPGEYRHEPSLALAAGDDGMDVIRRIMRDARAHLNDGGILVVELGDGREYFEAAFPDIPVTWLSTSGGDDQVFMIDKESLPEC
jgi:ribosomal protein L3 glutamine methyltransferase